MNNTIPMTSYNKKNYSKYSKCKYRGLHSTEGEERRVGCVVKNIKRKKIIYKSNKKVTRKIA